MGIDESADSPYDPIPQQKRDSIIITQPPSVPDYISLIALK
jgi:hypothetical protein